MNSATRASGHQNRDTASPHDQQQEIAAAAVAIADREGLDAVSMRRVAARLGTGAASLYRYLESREDLLDLMVDATGAEYVFTAPTGDWSQRPRPPRARPVSARPPPRQQRGQARSPWPSHRGHRAVRPERARRRPGPAATQRRLPAV